jgi:hypothetical protein
VHGIEGVGITGAQSGDEDEFGLAVHAVNNALAGPS